MPVLFILLISASSLLAQPWQWDLTAQNWRHPTGFPTYFNSICDIDGDGVDELLSQWGESSTHSTLILDSLPVLRWTTYSVAATGIVFSEVYDAENLDDLPGEELITMHESGFMCYSYDAALLQWSPREDLALQLPDSVSDSFFSDVVFGDYDQDSLLEMICTCAPSGEPLRRYERQQSGEWLQLDSIFLDPGDGWFDGMMYDGDFDHDGDIDLGLVIGLPVDPGNSATIMAENIGGLFWVREYNEFDFVHLSTGLGGDFDGDGNWEGLNAYYDRRDLYLVETSDADTGLVGVSRSYSMSPFGGTLLGWLQNSGETNLIGFETFSYNLFPGGSVYYTMAYSPNGWIDRGNGFYDWYSSECEFASLADFDGDGKQDILAVTRPNMSSTRNWRMYRNIGSDDSDVFTFVQNFRLIRFTSNADTVFSVPVLGQLDSDQALELAVIARPTGLSARVLFYSTSGSFADTTTTIQPHLSTGLPENVTNIRFVDLDGDGLFELFVRTTTWQVYFFRNNHWETYANILPEITSTIRGFADWDNNGTMDIFTDEGIYLNMSPSAADDPVVTPTSFTLSSYPNPFNAQTTIQFDLPRAGDVTLKLFDVLGRDVETIMDKPLSAGVHTVHYDAASMPSGVYFASLESGGSRITHKLLLLK